MALLLFIVLNIQRVPLQFETKIHAFGNLLVTLVLTSDRGTPANVQVCCCIDIEEHQPLCSFCNNWFLTPIYTSTYKKLKYVLFFQIMNHHLVNIKKSEFTSNYKDFLILWIQWFFFFFFVTLYWFKYH